MGRKRFLYFDVAQASGPSCQCPSLRPPGARQNGHPTMRGAVLPLIDVIDWFTPDPELWLFF